MKLKITIALIWSIASISCHKKTGSSTSNNNSTPSYVGTYVGKDSVLTYSISNGIELVATNVYTKSFVVASGALIGKNALLLNFQGHDSLEANFANGTIAVFSINNFIGTYNDSIQYSIEENSSIFLIKTYGKYKKQ